MAPLQSMFFLFVLSSAGKRSLGDDSNETFSTDCKMKKCAGGGPDIRFPFWVKSQPQYCGLDGFQLSCSGDHTLLNLSFSGDYIVRRINYLERYIYLRVPDSAISCPLKNLLSLNLSNSNFNFTLSSDTFSLVKCPISTTTSASDKEDQIIGPISCFNGSDYSAYVVDAEISMDKLPSDCEMIRSGEIFNNNNEWSSSLRNLIEKGEFLLPWNGPEIGDRCNSCESDGNHCGFNRTSNQTLCFSPHVTDSHVRLITGASIGGGIAVLVLVVILLYIYRKSDKEKETRLKVERFLANYKTLQPTRYTYIEIKKITSRFKHKLGQGGYGSVYKGELPNGIPVAVKMLEQSKGDGEEFTNEVATIGMIHHVNVVRLLGFSLERTRRALIYEFMPNESLEKFIFSKEGKRCHRSLSWEKLHEIAIGIASGIEYLHQGCIQRILHFDIKPHNILLDHNLHPKISDFGLAKLCSKDQSMVTMTAARGTTGYIAPELFSRNFGTVSCKSDVYSFGMLVLEMVGGRKNIDATVENCSQIYFPEWIYDKLIQGKGLGIKVDIQGKEEIAKKLAIVGLWCIQWNPTDRPSMKKVVQMLEGDLESLEIPPKPFISSDDPENGN